MSNPTATPEQKHPLYASLLHGLILLAVPALLVIGSIRLVMTPLFLQFEYTRAGFPMDFYGFSTEDRLQYGPLGIEYLLNGEDISFLGELTLPGDLCYPPRPPEITCPMYNEGELRHMADVKAVTQATYLAGVLISIFTAAGAFVLWRQPTLRYHLRFALMQGALLTLALIFTIVLLALAAWEFFFDTFHELFFAPGTWRFYFSDTLIRLYPEQFWLDAVITIGVLTTVGAFIILGLTWGLAPLRKRRQTSTQTDAVVLDAETGETVSN